MYTRRVSNCWVTSLLVWGGFRCFRPFTELRLGLVGFMPSVTDVLINTRGRLSCWWSCEADIVVLTGWGCLTRTRVIGRFPGRPCSTFHSRRISWTSRNPALPDWPPPNHRAHWDDPWWYRSQTHGTCHTLHPSTTRHCHQSQTQQKSAQLRSLL